jgi:hypothetical protein
MQATLHSLLLQPHSLNALLLKPTIQHILHEPELVQDRALQGGWVDGAVGSKGLVYQGEGARAA